MSFIVTAGRSPQGERAMTTYYPIVLRTVRFTFSISLLFLLNTHASASSPHCLNASSITPDEIYRGDGRLAGQPDCFRLQTPAAGLLMLDLAVPGPATAEPRLALLGPNCERSANVDVIESSASHLLVASDTPQTLTVCADAQDPLQALGEFKLRTAFAELYPGGTRKAEEIEAIPDPLTGETRRAEEIEAIPDPLTGETHKAEEIEAIPDPLTGETYKAEEIEAIPDPFADPWDTLCRLADFDDHSDSLLCATATGLGRSLRAEIDNGWGDDHDVFAFELSAPRTVRIETSGDTDTFGGLYDHLGQRLATADDGGNGDNFRLAKTLQPGLYFVRVEGSLGTRGAYQLTIDEIERW